MNNTSHAQTAATGGKYIVLEGPEGVGKTTQIQELSARLQAAGLPVRVLREPDSQSDLTARVIRQLTQDPRYPMNTRTEVLLYNAARAQSLQIIRESVAQGIICIVDRNYLTTLAIQYYGRGDVPDYATINNIISFAVSGVEPDLCVVMDAPVDKLVERARDRGSGERFDNLGKDFLERVRAGYLWEAQHRNFPIVDASVSPDQVSDVIWRLVSDNLALRQPSRSLQSVPVGVSALQTPDLPAEQPHEPATIETNVPATVHTDNMPNAQPPYVIKNENGSYSITPGGKEWLKDAVTNIDGQVYAFTGKLESLTVAASMARLSRRGDDMRVTILDEFAGKTDKDDKLIQRVISAYGDDSVQQLVGQYIVVENTTKLMTNILERGRLAAYLEQSTRYIYFDQKDAAGHYRYFVPKSLKKDVRQEYIMHMNAIFDIYSDMVKRLTDYVREHSDTPETERDSAWKGATRAQACDAARLVLPAATTTTVGIFASGQALENMIMQLQADPLLEARDTGLKILKEARKVIPSFLERADKPERGGATIAYRASTYKNVAELTSQYLAGGHAEGHPQAVQLTDVWPRNELDIVADILYEHSHLPLHEIRRTVAGWSYDKKVEVMHTYFGERLNRRHRPGRALEKNPLQLGSDV